MKRGLPLLLAGTAIAPGLAGCASQTVLLLPGEGAHPVGKLVELDKRNGSDKAVLDEANEALSAGASVRHNVKEKPEYVKLMAGLPAPAQSFTLSFATGEDIPDLSPNTEAGRNNLATLDHIRDEMGLRPGAEVQVTGHTDATGTDEINDPLSDRRARKFRDQLIAMGFPAGQVSAIPRGSRQPADPADPHNNAKNRRIEVIVR